MLAQTTRAMAHYHRCVIPPNHRRKKLLAKLVCAMDDLANGLFTCKHCGQIVVEPEPDAN